MGTSVFLSAQFQGQAIRALEEGEIERLGAGMRLFARIDLGSVPVFLSAMAEQPIRDYLLGRGSTIENALRGGESIDRIVAGNEFIDSVYLYNETAGILSTRSGLEGRGRQSDPGLLALLSSVRKLGLSRYVMRRVAFEGESGPVNVFTMILGNLPREGERMRSAFVANLAERKIRAVLVGEKSSGALYIVDDEGRFLSAPDESMFGAEASTDPRFPSILADAEDQGSKTVRASGGERFLATWVDEREMGWRFVSLSPERALFAPVLMVRNRVLAAALFFLVASVGIAFALSRAVRARERSFGLAQAYLRGELDGAEARALFPALRYPCAAALLRADGCRALIAVRGPAALYELGGELSTLLGSATPGTQVLRVADNSFLGLVAGDPPEARETIMAAAAALRERRGITLGGWILSRPLSFEELPDAFQSLQEARRLDFLRPEGRIDELGSDGGEGLASSQDEGMLPRIDKAVRSLGAGPDAARQATALLSLLRECGDPEIFRYAVAAAAGRVLALLGDSAERDLPGGAARFGSDLSQAERLSEAEGLLEAAAARLRERGDPPSERRQRELVGRVKAIVAERLAEPSLSTAAIAAEVGLSASYLRDVFKRLEGMALYDYLGTARLMRAKELLLRTGDSVREICDCAGFINYSYFFTFFKKSTGRTPTEFREEAERGPISRS